MSDDFKVDEIRESVALARIYSPGYTEEQFQAVTELAKRLGESGYLEAVCGIARLEKERHIHCAEALDACEQLLKDKAAQEQKLGDLGVTLEVVQAELKQTQDRLYQLVEAAEQAEAELQEEERKLATFREETKREKERTDKELEEYRGKADLTKQEIVMASQLKAEVDSHSLTFELVLDLAQEFTGCEDSGKELAKGLEKYGSLSKSIEALKSDLNRLQSHRAEAKTKIDTLEQECHQLENSVSRLQADVSHEEELRRFYNRYQGASPLMDHLAGWNQLFFVRCNNPVFAVTGAFSRSAGNARFWMDKPPLKCPHCGCGSNLLVYDEEPYEALGIPAGTPVRLQLGE